MPEQKLEPLRSTKYICDLVGLSRVTLWRHVHDGTLKKGIKIGRRCYWQHKDVVEYYKFLISGKADAGRNDNVNR